MADERDPVEHIVAPASAPDDVLRVEHITKSFGPVTALRDVSLHLKKGEVLGLLGDNGAGKSTLIKILCGFQKQDSGTMWLKGQPYEPKSVEQRAGAGLDVVYQDLALIDELTVYQNMFLYREERHSPAAVPGLAQDEARGAQVARRHRHQPSPARPPGRAPLRRPAPVDRGRPRRLLERRRAPARRAARGDGRQGGRDDPRADRAPEVGGQALDHHDPSQLRARARELRPREHDRRRRDRARQADRARPRSRSSPRSSSTNTVARARRRSARRRRPPAAPPTSSPTATSASERARESAGRRSRARPRAALRAAAPAPPRRRWRRPAPGCGRRGSPW